jgi:hypothetical protein
MIHAIAAGKMKMEVKITATFQRIDKNFFI